MPKIDLTLDPAVVLINPERKGTLLNRILKIAIQIVAMVAIFAALFWYVGSSSTGEGKSFVDVLMAINPVYLALAFASYLGINLLFTLRLQRVLAKEGVKTAFGKTLMAQYAGSPATLRQADQDTC